MKGWFPSHRQMYEPGHWLAPTRRDPANRRDAWSYLLAMATHKPRETANSGTLQRGELVVSIRTIARHLCWSKSKVARFMSDLESRTAIGTVRGTPDGTVYRVVNYDAYAVGHGGERDSERDDMWDRNGTEAGQEQEVKHKTKQLPPVPDGAFDEIKAAYPPTVRRNWKVAEDRYRKLVKKHGHDFLLKAVEGYAAVAGDPQFVKDPASFFGPRDKSYLADYSHVRSNGGPPSNGRLRSGRGR